MLHRVDSMTFGGLEAYAQLRLREHRPGPGDYDVSLPVGSLFTIGQRYHVPQCHTTPSWVGPGTYDIPSYMGQGPCAYLISRKGAECQSRASPDSGGHKSPRERASGVVKELALQPLAPQYSMALTPDTRAFSVSGKGKDLWGRSETGPIGPGAYDLPSVFGSVMNKHHETAGQDNSPDHTRNRHDGHQGSNHPDDSRVDAVQDDHDMTARQTHTGKERDRRHTWHRNAKRLQDVGPGPGAYDIVRFGDVLPAPCPPRLGSHRPLTTTTTTTSSAAARASVAHLSISPCSTVTLAASCGGASFGSPGPGSYNDPTTIEHRLTLGRQRAVPMCLSSTFGRREGGTAGYDGGAMRRLQESMLPGPGSYDAMTSYKAMLSSRGHAPCFRRPGLHSAAAAAKRRRPHTRTLHNKKTAATTDAVSAKDKPDAAGTDSVPITCPTPNTGCPSATGEADQAKYPGSPFGTDSRSRKPRLRLLAAKSTATSHLPSDFDSSCYKGCSFAGRYARPVKSNPMVGPGSYEVYDSTLSERAAFIEACTFDAFALRASQTTNRRRRGPTRAQTDKDARAARPALQVRYALVERTPPAATLNLSQAWPVYDNGTPGPGCYTLTYDETQPASRSTLFYKGSFDSPPGGRHGTNLPRGVSSCYNENTMYSNSVRADVLCGRGATFGIQYPARALYQACKPRDERTNVNCEYESECTWKSAAVSQGR